MRTIHRAAGWLAVYTVALVALTVVAAATIVWMIDGD